jgi:hypothetical protein
MAQWFNTEINNMDQRNISNEQLTRSTRMCRKLIKEMNDINQCISNLPIFMYPMKSSNTHNVLKPKVRRRRKLVAKFGPGFICDICEEKFQTGQGLGGHMSRKHPKASLKYNKKKEIRESRTQQRNAINESKKRLLESKNFDYDELIQTAEGRRQIKEVVKNNEEEYKELKKNMKQRYQSKSHKLNKN